MRVSGAAPADLVPGLYANGGLLTDGTWLYYTAGISEAMPTSTVYRVLAAGGTPETVVAGLQHPSGLSSR